MLWCIFTGLGRSVFVEIVFFHAVPFMLSALVGVWTESPKVAADPIMFVSMTV
jgi:hypothetical protein